MRCGRWQLTYMECGTCLTQGAAIGHPEVRNIHSEDRKTSLLRRLRRAFAWGRLKLPFGVRTVFGLALLAGGIFGFLPILGFWMIPLGLVLIALDVPPLRRQLRSWLHRAVHSRGGRRNDQRDGRER